MGRRYYLCDNTSISGIEDVVAFTKGVATYTVYLNVDSYPYNGIYYVWAEEIKDASHVFVTVSVPTGNKSNPNMSICAGTLVVWQNHNEEGFRMDKDMLLEKISVAARQMEEDAHLFRLRLANREKDG